MEHGQSALQAIRKWRFSKATKECPIIIFGPPSARADAPVMIREGANDFIEVKFSQAEALAYLKPLDFRNVLAKKTLALIRLYNVLQLRFKGKLPKELTSQMEATAAASQYLRQAVKNMRDFIPLEKQRRIYKDLEKMFGVDPLNLIDEKMYMRKGFNQSAAIMKNKELKKGRKNRQQEMLLKD